jgi:hypothetical protein
LKSILLGFSSVPTDSSLALTVNLFPVLLTSITGYGVGLDQRPHHGIVACNNIKLFWSYEVH